MRSVCENTGMKGGVDENVASSVVTVVLSTRLLLVLVCNVVRTRKSNELTSTRPVKSCRLIMKKLLRKNMDGYMDRPF
ncbi:hypothetical protein RRSWK_03975 [Rhodopirellula sp. SWK7]|nr:hypothetical protein RRSWK_03975 [Rhodopirellula sp. SWK7]